MLVGPRLGIFIIVSWVCWFSCPHVIISIVSRALIILIGRSLSASGLSLNSVLCVIEFFDWCASAIRSHAARNSPLISSMCIRLA